MSQESPSRTPRALLVAAVLGLALVVVGSVMFVVPERSSAAKEPARDLQIVSQATSFATEFNTYDSADLEDYQRRLRGILTEGYAADSTKTTTALFEVIAPKKQKSTDPKVKAVAIESSDSDSAKVLVVVDATVTNTDLDEPSLRQMRWIVSMQKEKGDWRVDAFESVPAEPASGSEVTPTPSASPSTEVTP